MKLSKKILLAMCMLAIIGFVVLAPGRAKAAGDSTKDIGGGHIYVTDQYVRLVDEDGNYVSEINGYSLSDLGISFDSTSRTLVLDNMNLSSSYIWGVFFIEGFADITILCKGSNVVVNPHSAGFFCICEITVNVCCEKNGSLKMQCQNSAFLVTEHLNIKDANITIVTGDMAFQDCEQTDISNSIISLDCKNGHGKISNVRDSWIKENGWSYFANDGSKVTGWQKISGKWYCFDTAGSKKTGWLQEGSKWYYLGTSGAMATGWKEISGKWYYFGTTGVMATGWKQISDKWYYFGTNGAMATGWKQISDKWYYFGTSGAMATGWKQISDKWYYFGTNGTMTTGWKQISDKWYYFDANGVMVTGTKKIDGKTYTFASNGVWIK